MYFITLPILVRKIFTFYRNYVLLFKCPCPGSKGWHFVFGVKHYTIKGRGLTEIDQISVQRRLLGPTAAEGPEKGDKFVRGLNNLYSSQRFLSSLAQKRNSDLSRFIFEASRSHTIRKTHTDRAGRKTHTDRAGRSPLNEWSAHRRGRYINNTNQRQEHPCRQRYSNPWPQQSNGRWPMPYPARPSVPATKCISVIKWRSRGGEGVVLTSGEKRNVFRLLVGNAKERDQQEDLVVYGR